MRVRLDEIGLWMILETELRRVDQIEGSQIARGRWGTRKTIRKTKERPEINELDRDMIYDKTLWHRLIHVADPTLVG
jgi:hypothetical protein